jgi:2-haloalkanoic acid dehalogenase type II
VPRYDAIGFDLLTALLDTWSRWKAVAGDGELGMRWHAASQAMLRGRAYRPFEDVVRDSAREVGVSDARAEEMLRRWGDFEPWPDVPAVLERLGSKRRFIVTNCSVRLGERAAARAGAFELVMTAERAGAYKPDPRPYRAALDALGLDPARVVFVAGSAHDVGGASRVGMDVYWANRGNAPAPADATARLERPDLRDLPALALS